jgi:hypothetical protein
LKNLKAPFRSVFGVVVLGAVWGAEPAEAVFHLMQIEQVIGGVNGDTTAQAVQLRMRSALQNSLSPTRIRAYDAAGLNPVLIYDFAAGNFTVGSGGGRRILLVTPSFPLHTTPAAVDDVSGMVNLIPESYLNAGCLTFEHDAGGAPIARLCWGGSNYTGPTNVTLDNDANGDVAPPFPTPLPSNGAQALRFDGLATDPTTTNAADYIVTAGAAVFINNAAVPGMFTVNACVLDTDCNDGVACTMDTCAAPAPTCTFTPNNALCDNGEFCDGVESCDVKNGCVSPGDPCAPAMLCHEDLNMCVDCLDAGDCDDGVTCTDDACVDNNCENVANDNNCVQNGIFCDGTEICDAALGCISPGDPCPPPLRCDEEADECVPAVSAAGMVVMGLLLFVIAGPVVKRGRRH